MLIYCLKFKKDTENVDSKFLWNKKGTTMLSSKGAVSSSKISKRIKKQGAKRLLSC